MGKTSDFVNLDAEGWSVNLLRVYPFEKLPRVKMICVEYDKSYNWCLELLEMNGFQFLHKTAENLIVVRT